MYARISQGISQGAYARHLQGLCTQCSHLQAQLGGGGHNVLTPSLYPPPPIHTCRRSSTVGVTMYLASSTIGCRGSARIQKPPKRTCEWRAV